VDKIFLAATQARSGCARRQRADHTQLDALTRFDLLAIAQDRFGTSSLPNDGEGRRFLRAYLLKGMPATQALDLAPWSRDGGEFFRIVASVDADRRTPNAERLGELIEFTFERLQALKRKGISIRHVAPFDAQRFQVQQFWKDEERIADRERKLLARKRSKEENMPTLTKRAKQVHKAVATDWTSVSDIMDAVVLRDQRNRKLATAVQRVAVHRALDELVASGLVEDRTEAGEHRMATRFARRSHMTGRNSVSDNIATHNKKTSGDVATQ
jgi:hypothetical protein